MTANLLNGRAKPSKRAKIEARFDRGDEVIATGQWSDDRKWVEVYGGETGVVWCDARYLTETVDEIVVCNLGYNKIKIRKRPIDGRVTGYLYKGRELHIDRIVLGWGHCKKGWIDLNLAEIED